MTDPEATTHDLNGAAAALLSAAHALLAAVASDVQSRNGRGAFAELARAFDDGVAVPRVAIDFGTTGARLRVALVGQQNERQHVVELLDVAGQQQSRAGGTH